MRLRITSFGESAEGIALTGNPKSGEPAHVRIAFPGGDVEVVRAKDGKEPDYWVHVRINHPQHSQFVTDETLPAKLVDARLDQLNKAGAKADLGDFNSPQLYHVALRVQPDWEAP